jgi:hypothetical protein
MLLETRCASSARVAFAAIAALLALGAAASAPSPAAAQAGGIVVGWSPAPGPVVSYEVSVSVDAGEFAYLDTVAEARIAIDGPPFEEGDALRFQVVGVADDGSYGPASEISDVIFYPNVPAPASLAVENGTARHPTLLSWDPVPFAQDYLVFRSEAAGEQGRYLVTTDASSFEDTGADLDVTYYYSLATRNGRQVSDFTEQVSGRRSGHYPELVTAPASLSFTVDPDEPTQSQTLALSNTGDWPLSFSAWPGAPWLSVSEFAGEIDGPPVDLTVTVSISSMWPGTYQSTLRIFSYYEPPPGETFELGPPLEVPVSLTIPSHNDPPTIVSPLAVTLAEGEVVEVAVVASDPDGDALLEVAMGQLPSFATFVSLGNGVGRLTLAPDGASAGTYQAIVVAWDFASYVVETFTIVVEDGNHPPLAAEIPDTVIPAGSTTSVLVFAWDPDPGDRIAMTPSSLPGFATFKDFGNGTGGFRFGPTPADVGEYLIVVGVVDDGLPPAFAGASFRLTVSP